MSDGINILYIDDNRDHLDIVQAMLARKSFTCETINNAKEGLEVALTKPFHIILLDIQMPKISGIDILAQLEERRQAIGTRIVAITADSTIFARQNPLEMGFDAFISKPITPHELYHVVNQLSASSE